MIISLGSTSVIKKNAILKAFPHAKIILNDVKSGVSEQPIGQQETELGACNRCKGARKAVINADLAIGIESGMWQTSEGFVDGACIIIEDKKGATHIFWTDALLIPADHPRGNGGMWSCYKDPHSVITQNQRTRSDFIGDAIIEWNKSKK